METVWFVLVAFMLAAYVMLDGFDLGAGVVHLLVARTDAERRMVLRTIGPVWDGNEVWLLAAGGTLFFAFPMLYASSFSGFYLPLNIVLWLLVLRAVGIEFRAHLENTVWCDFFDGVFALGSTLLTVFFGAALGNVIRGVPLDKNGYFFEALWTDFQPFGAQTGVLDWYTVLTGVVALVALTIHGALWVAMKTEGDLSARCTRLARILWPALLVLTIGSLAATMYVRPGILSNFVEYPIGFVIPLAVTGSLAGMWRGQRQFLSSCLYLGTMLAGAAFAMYPTLLPASTNPAYSLTIYNSAAGSYALRVGVIWWGVGMVVAIGYFVLIYRMFRGKVPVES